MKNKIHWKLAFRAFVLSLLLFLITCVINSFSSGWSAIIVSICFIMLTYILLHDQEGDHFTTILWAILIGRLCCDIPIRMFSFKDSLCSLMLTVFEVWNILMMAWYSKKKSPVIIYLWMAGWLYFLLSGHKMWLEFVFHKEVSLYDLYIREILNR